MVALLVDVVKLGVAPGTLFANDLIPVRGGVSVDPGVTAEQHRVAGKVQDREVARGKA